MTYKKYPSIVIHTICWLLFILNEIGYIYYATRKLEPLFIYVCYYSLNICFFYSQAELLKYVMDKPKQNYLRVFTITICHFILFLAVKSLFDFFLATKQPNTLKQLYYIETFLPKNINRGIYFSILSAFYWTAGHVNRYRKRVAKVEKKHLVTIQEKSQLEIRLSKSRNAYLQQQINPHLLFNTLNFVYGSVYRYSSNAARAIWLLAEIMRFSIDDTGVDGKVELAKEMEQLNHLLEINRYRFNEELFILTDFSGDFTSYRIIPLILLTLTENLFKHGNLRDADSPATLKVMVSANGKFYYYCKNLKKVKSRYLQNSRIGLHNLRVRLDYSYGGKYKLNILEDDRHFELTLNISL